MNIQVWLTVVLFLCNIVITTVVSLFVFSRALDKRLSGLDLSLEQFRSAVNSQVASLKAEIVKDHTDARTATQVAIVRLDVDTHELSVRVRAVETGQDEWSRTLRARTHELANNLNTLGLRVDRLERPTKGTAS